MRKLKVAIIGAGPSGFAVAEVLRRPEFIHRFDFTIYERNNYVGGKCCTVFADGRLCNDQPGGYEVGATLISKHMPSYQDLRKILEKYDVATASNWLTGRKTGLLVSHGKPLAHRKLHWRNLWRSLRSYEQYGQDYIRYSGSKHAGYANRPKALYKNLSRHYDGDVRVRLSYAVQGFGYADMDDRYLTPPLLYYHQYLEPAIETYPLYTLDNGAQGIWARLAANYPKSSIRLNQKVIGVERTPNNVAVITQAGSETYDYLVVATPLKPALEYLDISRGQQRFLEKMKYNHYVTVLCRVRGLKATGTFNMPACNDREKLGQVLLCYQRYADSDYVTAYLYVKKGQRSDDQAIIERVQQSLEKDLGAHMLEPSKAKVFHWTDYFGHLGTKDLNAGWYENFEKEFQGRQRTLFVSSGLHMETVGASVQFATRESEYYARLWR